MLTSLSPRPELLRSRDHRTALDVLPNRSDAADGSADGLVSIVVNRQGRDFSARELALIEQARRVLGRMFRRTRLLETTREHWKDEAASEPPPLSAAALPLTGREREVLRWAAAGKTDRDIADILAISHRTVHKHLQRVYSKLGVETRTAAVMRAVGHA